MPHSSEQLPLFGHEEVFLHPDGHDPEKSQSIPVRRIEDDPESPYDELGSHRLPSAESLEGIRRARRTYIKTKRPPINNKK